MAFHTGRRKSCFEVNDQVSMAFAKLGWLPGRPQVYVDLWEKVAKLGDTLAQPQRGQRRFRTDGQSALLCRPEKIAARVAQGLKPARDTRKQRTPIFTEHNPVAGTGEQFRTEPGFEVFHMLADNRMADVQLIRRPGNTLMACGGLEGA